VGPEAFGTDAPTRPGTSFPRSRPSTRGSACRRSGLSRRAGRRHTRVSGQPGGPLLTAAPALLRVRVLVRLPLPDCGLAIRAHPDSAPPLTPRHELAAVASPVTPRCRLLRTDRPPGSVRRDRSGGGMVLQRRPRARARCLPQGAGDRPLEANQTGLRDSGTSALKFPNRFISAHIRAYS
jgi:hypothetical protein